MASQRGGKTITTETFLDKKSYRVLGKVTDHIFDVKKGLIPVKEVLHITYQNISDNNPTFPKAVDVKFIKPDKTEYPYLSLKYDKYERYFPALMELDAEKRFGVSLPDTSDRPPLPPAGEYLIPKSTVAGRPRSSSWWVYLTAAIFALAAVGTAVIIRRRRLD